MWQPEAESSYDPELKAKGDEIQKLSVIETLPQLLAQDANACITRVLPKIQQSLPTASTEFHMAASVIFKQIMEQRLVSNATFTDVFLQSILSSLENREPVISHAWLETMLDVIEYLPVDVIKREILPVAIKESQESQLERRVNSRLMCCRLIGKISTRFDETTVRKEIFPTVQKLCQDVNNSVRACIAQQLRFIAPHLGEDILKLLPYFIELVSDEESNVRRASAQSIAYLLPLFSPDTAKDVMVPLIKVTCDNALKSDDNVVCTIALEFGKIAQNSERFLTPIDKTWFLKYFIQLSQMGTTATSVEETKQDFPFLISNRQQTSDRNVECRQNCAFNIPAMFVFATSCAEGVQALIPTFRNLASDSYYMVRRTIACTLHEITRILAFNCGLIKNELIRLLRDDHEEVLQGLIANLSVIIEHLIHHKILGLDHMDSSSIDLGRALIKCESEVSSTNNWRLSALMLNQFEILPKCYPSEFINTHLVPVVTNRIAYSRPLPVRLAAGRTLLIFLRYNLKSQQRVEIRIKICTDFAHSSSCYQRMVFVRMMVEAMTIFSSVYFKEHFCTTLLSLMNDPVANVRLKVVTLCPAIKACIRLPGDKKLLGSLEGSMRNLLSVEKDRDVITAINEAIHMMESIEVRVDSQPTPSKLSRYDSEDMKKYEEEKRLEEKMAGGKISASSASTVKKPNIMKPTTTRHVSDASSKEPPKTNGPRRPPLIRQNAVSNEAETSKASTSSDNLTTSWSRFTSNNPQLKHPWERATTSFHNTNLTSTNPSYTSSNEYSAQKVQCSCYELADRIFRTQALSSGLSEPAYHSDSSHCSCLNGSNYLKTTNLFQQNHDYRFPDFTKPSLLTNVREDKHDIWQDLMLTRSSFANKYRTPEFSGFQSHYNPYWTFSSMPEIPMPLVDDEFMVDAGIRIPSQLATSQSTSKIPNLQDIIYRNKKIPSSTDRLRRACSTTYEKSKTFGYGLPKHLSFDYDDSSKTSSSSSSINMSSNNRESQFSSQSGLEDRSKSSSMSSQNRTRFGFELSQRKPLEEKGKRNTMLIDQDRVKPLQPKNFIDRNKRHSSNLYSMKLPETKESKLSKFKRHSMEVRRFPTLDVNHNQGLSKIPVRNIHISGSRTAPVTRTSSPIRIPSELFEKVGYSGVDGFSRERRLRRFRSSDEEVDRLCQKF